ncbi:MAG: hypothetical protein M1812_003327 [Candelaria pacifica]|nr:MAG: hypothetical protein M1812_003327 [Candelaria pacifica]
MPPQEHIPLSANILGTIGTSRHRPFLLSSRTSDARQSSGAFKVWYNWRKKKTEGLPGLMVFLWAMSVAPLGVYAIVQNFTIAIQIQPQIFGVLSLVSWAQTLIYHDQWKTWKASLAAIGTGLAIAGTEVLLVMTLRGPYRRGVSWPITMVGVIAAVVLAAGLIPPYFEIWKRRGRVVGIIAQQTFDVLGGSSYIACLVLEGGIFTSHWIWLARTRKLRKEAKVAGKSIEDADFSPGHTTDNENPVFPRSREKISSCHDLELGSVEDKTATGLTREGVATDLALPEPLHHKG